MDSVSEVKAVEEAKAAEKTPNDLLKEQLEWGHINFESANGIIQSNCKAVSFSTDDEMNRYFKDNPGCYATQVFLGDRTRLALINRTLTDEEQEILRDNSEVMGKMLEEKKKAREEKKAALADETHKRTEELERLVDLGKKCEHNHGAVISENAKLKKELKAAKKGKK